MPAKRAPVTPAGVRDGDPEVLEALCQRRGPAVLAYCEHVCAPGQAGAAAAAAFAHFRAQVASAPRPAAVDAERLLLTGTRHAAAARAPRPVAATGLARRLGRRRPARACMLVPDLLVAHAEGRLSEADQRRLSSHLGRCTTCHAARRRFAAAHDAYLDPPADEVPEPVARAIVSALAAAAPVSAPVSAPTPTPAPVVAQRGGKQQRSGADSESLAPPEPGAVDEVVVTDARPDADAEAPDPEGPAPAAPAPDPQPARAERRDAAGRAGGRDRRTPATARDGGDRSADGPRPRRQASSHRPAVETDVDRYGLGHPEQADYLTGMPAELYPGIAPLPHPSHHPRPRHHRREAVATRRHGPAWGIVVPSVVLTAALLAVLAVAGVFSGSSHHAAVVSAPLPSTVLPGPVAAVSHRHAHRTTHVGNGRRPAQVSGLAPVGAGPRVAAVGVPVVVEPVGGGAPTLAGPAYRAGG